VQLREWHAARANGGRSGDATAARSQPSRFHEVLLQICQQHALPSLAVLTVFKHLSDAALPISDAAYVCVLRVLVHNAQPPAGSADDLRIATKVLGKMAEEGLDLATTREYDPVMTGLASHGLVEEALELMDTAVYANATPALATFTAVRDRSTLARPQQPLGSELTEIPPTICRDGNGGGAQVVWACEREGELRVASEV
jgi:hypothetical protein